MADTRIVISANGDQAIDALNDLGKKIGSLEKQARDNSKGWLEWGRDVSTAINQTIEVLGKAQRVAEGFWSVAEEAAKRAEQAGAFRSFSRSVGADAEGILTALKTASRGTVREMDLMQTASKAMALGVSRDATQIADLFKIAEYRGKLLGESTQKAFDDIVVGIGRASPKILDNLGIRLPEGFEALTKGMTETQKIATLLQQTLESEAETIKNASANTDAAADSFKQFRVAIDELQVEFGRTLLPILTQVAGFIKSDLIPAAEGAIATFDQMTGVLELKLTAQMEAFGDAGVRAVKKMAIAQAQARAQTLGNLEEMRSELAGIQRNMASRAGRSEARPVYARNVEGALADIREVEPMAALGSRASYLREQIALAENAQTQVRMLEKELSGFEQKRMNKKLVEPFVALKDSAVEAGKFVKKLYEDIAEPDAPAKASARKARTLSSDAKEAREEMERMKALGESLFRGFAMDVAQSGLESNLTTIDTIMGSIAASAGLFNVYLRGSSGAAAGIAEGLSARTPIPRSGTRDLLGVTNVLAGAMGAPLPSQGRVEISSLDIKQDALKEIETPLSRVFNDAMVKGLEGGNFFQALADGLRRVAIEAFANEITRAIFGASGAVSGVIGGASGATSAGGGGGLLGGIFKPMRHSAAAGGGINWMNLGTNLLIGTALGRLTSPGGLFGGRVVHGQEVLGQVGDINSRVNQAVADRSSLMGAAGLSAETRRALQDLTLWTAGYSTSKSGDGIFSKKTTTYALNDAQAQSSLAEFARLTAKANAEIAAREFEIAFRSLSDPLAQLTMKLEDLRKAIAEGGATESNMQQLRLMEEQLRQSFNMASQGRQSEALNALLGMPFASAGVSYAGSMGGSITEWLAGGDDALKRLIASATGQGRGSPDAQVGFRDATGQWRDMTGQGVSSTADMLAAMALASGNAAQQMQLTRDLRSGNTATVDAARGRQRDAIANQMAIIEDVLAESEKQVKNLAYSLETRQAAYDRWKIALQAKYAAQEELLNLEESSANSVAGQQQRIADILGTMLTRIGETSTIGGQQVVVLSAGQPAGVALARQLLDALGGAEPELASALTQFMGAVGGDRWG